MIERDRPWDERLRRLGRRRLRRLRRAARGRRPRGVRRAVAQGRRACTAAPDYAGRYDTWLVVVRGAGHRGGRLRLDQPAPRRRRGAAGAAPRLPGVALRRRAADRAGDRRDWARGASRRSATSASTRGCVVAPRRPAGDPRRARAPRTRSTVVLRQQRGLRRARQVDTVEAALVGACDGELTVGQILDALAQLLDRDPAADPGGVPPGGPRAGGRGLPRAAVGGLAPGAARCGSLRGRATVFGREPLRGRRAALRDTSPHREGRKKEATWHTSW